MSHYKRRPDGTYRFPLKLGETIVLGGRAYIYDGDGHLRGAAAPWEARRANRNPGAASAVDKSLFEEQVTAMEQRDTGPLGLVTD